MTDDEVVALLNSPKELVVVEAPAGCGKTYQGANYVRRATSALNKGRVLILTHTHAACSQFAKESKAASGKIEIRTIDSLVVNVACIYHKSLDLPPDPAAWARRQGKGGFDELGIRVSQLLSQKRMVCEALADRYPIIVADEHQDSRAEQHQILMSLHAAGARLRIFGDPMQLIYEKTKSAILKSRERWDSMKNAGAAAELETPHRWREGSPELGKWILLARETLKSGGVIDLTQRPPSGLKILFADNIAPSRDAYKLGNGQRRPIDSTLDQASTMLVLTGQNGTVNALRAFWGRRIPIWEGHVREPLGALASALTAHCGDPFKVAEATVTFIEKVCVGFSASSHSARFHAEITSACNRKTVGKPAFIQEMAKEVLKEPNHIGVARCLARLSELVEAKETGFDGVHIDHRREMRDAIKLAEFDDAEDGLAELHRRRTFARHTLPSKVISTIHKAKGLECDNAMVISCDSQQFTRTDYARSKLYVALSRAKRSLTLVVSRNKPSPLFKVPLGALAP